MKYDIEIKKSIEIDFQQALKILIALNKEHREVFKEYQLVYPPTEFIMEFGIISLDIGRSVGKTKFIRENAKPNDLVLVHNLEEIRYWNHYLPMTKVMCPKINSIQYIKSYGQKFDTIWIDEPKLIFKEFSKYDIMKHLIVDYGQTVVMLGKYI
jgi:hypothetical protein